MKEASGELSMTVVVIVAAVAIIAILSTLVPSMGDTIKKKWESMIGTVVTDTLVTELR